MYVYIGLSMATGLPWEYFARQDDHDPDVNVTYMQMLKALQPPTRRTPGRR